MKPTHGFKNLQIGFGKEKGVGGGGMDKRGLLEESRYQSQQKTALC